MAANKNNGHLRRLIVPSWPLKLDVLQDDGAVEHLNFRLSFDFNAFARITEVTGYDVIVSGFWKLLIANATLSAAFWASLHAHHPEYRSLEALEIVRSYISPDNSEVIAEAVLDAYIATLSPDKRAQHLKMKEKILAREDPMKDSGTKAPGPDAPLPGSGSGSLPGAG